MFSPSAKHEGRGTLIVTGRMCDLGLCITHGYNCMALLKGKDYFCFQHDREQMYMPHCRWWMLIWASIWSSERSGSYKKRELKLRLWILIWDLALQKDVIAVDCHEAVICFFFFFFLVGGISETCRETSNSRRNSCLLCFCLWEDGAMVSIPWCV